MPQSVTNTDTLAQSNDSFKLRERKKPVSPGVGTEIARAYTRALEDAVFKRV